MQIYETIKPIEEVLKRAVLERDVIFTDDSIIPLQVKGNGKVKKARLWVYVRAGPGPPLTVFDFSPDRSKKRPLDFLHLEWIIEVACWVHTRRKFDEAASSRPVEATAEIFN